MVLCADSTMRAVIEEIVARPESLQIRNITCDVRASVLHTDGGLRRHGVRTLSVVRSRYRHGLLLFDRNGCGDAREADIIEQDLEVELAHHWSNRAAAVVIDPELEEWIMGGHRHFQTVVGLGDVNARRWLAAHGWPQGRAKPAEPKAALTELFRAFNAKRSAASYRRVARRASLRTDRCRSRSFCRLVDLLRTWFPLT